MGEKSALELFKVSNSHLICDLPKVDTSLCLSNDEVFILLFYLDCFGVALPLPHNDEVVDCFDSS